MHVYLFSGIAVALVLARLTGFSPGGVVVAGCHMFIEQPLCGGRILLPCPITASWRW